MPDTRWMDSLKGLMHPATLRISFKVLLSIVLSEALIMGGLYLLPVELSELHKTIMDTLLLGLISAAVIHLWVVRPLKQAWQQNSLFNTLVNNLDAGLVVTRPNGNDQSIIYVNPAFERITGYRLEEVVGKNPRLLQGEDVDQESLGKTRQAMREGKPVRVLQKNRRKNGESFWNDLHLNPIMDSGGKVDYWVGLIHDMTATRTLERENLRWASALKGSGEAVCVFDIDGVIEYANAAYCRNARLPLEQLIGTSILGLWQVGPEFDALVSSIKQQQAWSGRHKRLRGDQTSYEALTTVTPIRDEDGSLCFVGVHRDISDMVLMEEKLRQSQKMEAVGMLVSGIAHDFNNVLAGILGNLYLIKRHLKENPKMFRRIEGVEEQGYAAAGMIRQLLNFARQGAVDSKNIDLVPFVKELSKFSRVSVPENIDVDISVEGESFIVCCDPVQMQQTLLNMIVNATHAIESKAGAAGRIILRIAAAMPPQQLLCNDSWAYDKQPDQWVRISIEDNGIGMDSLVMGRVFEPFYTTKDTGVGTGLGLAMVQSYIQTLHGAIDLHSQTGEGSCFDIYLPLLAQTSAVDGLKQSTVRRGNGELVLLADDDEGIRGALCDILESANYRVIEAVNGEEAMQKFAEFGSSLHLAILDVVMPKSTGVQVARHIRSVRRELPVVFMTAYAHQVLYDSGEPSALMLAKPWDIENLNAVLALSLKIARV